MLARCAAKCCILEDAEMVYKINVAGVERDLPLCPISDSLNIAAFVLFGDVELTEKCAEALLEKAPEHDVLITAESKGIPPYPRNVPS